MIRRSSRGKRLRKGCQDFPSNHFCELRSRQDLHRVQPAMASIPGASSRWAIRCRLFAASAGRRLFQAMCSAAGRLPFLLFWHGWRQHSVSAAASRHSFPDISGIGEPPIGQGVHATSCSRDALTGAIHTIAEAMSRRAASVVVVANDTGVMRWSGDSSRLIPLTSVLSGTETGLQFDRDFVATIFADEPTHDATDRRTQKRRSSRSAGIESLVHEMQRHLLAARDHAKDSQKRSGAPRLLPRPSQADLAQRTHLSESTVSRCLKDDSAILLRLLWETSEDIDRVMAWSGAIRPPADDYE